MKSFVSFEPLLHPGHLPRPLTEYVSTDCPLCHRPIRFPVPRTHTDWEKVATMYREIHEETYAQMDRMILDLDAMMPPGEENPIRKYLSNEWQNLRDFIQRRFTE